MTFVLDASMALSWLFERVRTEERNRADAALERLESGAALVPALWQAEVVNGLLVAERAGKAHAAEIGNYLERLGDLPISTDSVLPGARRDVVLALGRQYRLSAYDATYLELAMRMAGPLATFDADLMKAAKAAGVGTI